MESEPETSETAPRRRRKLWGLVLGVALVGLVPLTDLLWTPSTDTSGNRRVPEAAFEQLPNRAAHPDGHPATSRLQVVAGARLSEGRRATGVEAIVRLHVYLALRDVYPAALGLDWSPAGTPSNRSEGIAERCDFKKPPRRVLNSGGQPDPLNRTIDPAKDERLFFLLSGPPSNLQVEALVCNRRGARRAQVMALQSGSEGEVIRELATWAAAVTGSAEPGGLAESWTPDLVSSRPGMSRYGEVLVGSTGTGGAVENLLEEASEVLPEAAWLLAQLGTPRDALAHLRRARLQRVSFTAAIEDRAILLLSEDQLNAALRELSLLTLETDTRTHPRPVRELVAARLLAMERPRAALAVIESLDPANRQRPGAARISALANLGLQRDQDAADQVELWLAAQPRSGDALVAAGRLRAAANRWDGAQAAWRQAVMDNPDLRSEALRDWAEAALDRQDTAALEATLAAVGQGEASTQLNPFGLELQAYLAARQGDFVAALDIYDDLASRNLATKSVLQNRCQVALPAGQEAQATERCAGLKPADLEGALASSAFDSRRPGLLPGYRLDTSKAALFARKKAPHESAVSVTALHSLGPSADPEFREELLARWRIAVGAGVEVPPDVFAAPGPND